MVGHEPTWSALASALVGGGELRLAPAALAHVALDVDGWAEVKPGSGVLRAVIPPALLRGPG
jgi:phosphohistidine phosphatase